MKRWLLALWLLAAPLSAETEYVPVRLELRPFMLADVANTTLPSGGFRFTGGVIQSPILFPDGTNALPVMAFNSQPALGWLKGGTNTMQLSNPNNLGQLILPTQSTPALNAATPGLIGSLGGGGTTGTYQRTNASWGWSISGVEVMALFAGTLNLGIGAGSNTPALQSFIAQSAIAASTNAQGSDAAFSGGQSTGNALPAVPRIQRTIRLGSGTAFQAYADAIVPCGTKTLSNTTGTLATLATIAAPSNSAGAASFDVSVQCNDGTNFDSDMMSCTTAWVNKAGVFTIGGAGTPVCTGTIAANNSGSCTIAASVTSGASLINLNVTPVIGTITPTTTTAFIVVTNNSGGAVTCQ